LTTISSWWILWPDLAGASTRQLLQTIRKCNGFWNELEFGVLTDDAYGNYPQCMAECDAKSTQKDPITDDDVDIGLELDSTCHKNLLTLIKHVRKIDWRTGLHNCPYDEHYGNQKLDACENETVNTSPTDRRTISKILQDRIQSGIIANSTSTSPKLLVNIADGLWEEALRQLWQAESTDGDAAILYAWRWFTIE